ncbi:hypothetical protein SUDANB121_00084 [Nocardiopsis dassonvillei]|uniref:hypothetical protein n=1 Tax=Nocardiopsis dassonvillei TaxID=2014 RepID=UPI003F57DD29
MTAPHTRFSGAEITVDLLDDLAAQGPGGLIVADLDQARYKVACARDLDWDQNPVITYGHGDLTWDLGHWGGDRKWVAEAATDQARDEIAHWIDRARSVPPLHQGLRANLHRQGWDLDQFPLDTGFIETDFRRRITDHLVLRADPGFTLKLSSELRRPPHLAMIADLHHQSRYLGSWAEKVTSIGMPLFIRHLQVRIRRYQSVRT